MAITVNELQSQGVQGFEVSCLGEAFIEDEALVDVGDIVVREEGGDRQLDVGLHVVGQGLSLHLCDSLFEHLRIKLKADGLNGAGLVFSQQVSGPTQLQVMGGDGEACAQFRACLQDFQSTLCFFADGFACGDEEVGIGPFFGAADAAAQLIELCESKSVGAVHNHRIGSRNIQSAFDDGCAQQHLNFLLNKVKHYAFQPTFAQLPMSDAD